MIDRTDPGPPQTERTYGKQRGDRKGNAMAEVTLHLTAEQAANVERIHAQDGRSGEEIILQHLRYSPGSPILDPIPHNFGRGSGSLADFGSPENC